MTDPRGPQRSTDSEDSVSLLWLAAILFRERRKLMLLGLAGLALGVVLALFRPLRYTTNFSFLPQTQRDSRAGLAGLAGQFGINLSALGGSDMQPPQFYTDLLGTRAVLGPIARDSVPAGPGGALVPLPLFLKIRNDDSAFTEERTLNKLRTDIITATVEVKTGVISVRVKTASPQVSLQIARRLLEGLNHFNLVTRQSQAREERLFTEGRLREARDSLRRAEDNLLRFTQSNRDLSNSNAGTLQRNRLQRDVDMQQQIVTSLAQQYEENRIREVRDTPVLTVIETPVLAPHRDARHGVLIVFLTLVGVSLLGVIMVVGRDMLTRSQGRDPGLELLSAEWQRMRRRPGAAAS